MSIEQLIRKAQAQALRDAADELLDGIQDLPTRGAGLSYRNCTAMDVRFLRERADALEVTA